MHAHSVAAPTSADAAVLVQLEAEHAIPADRKFYCPYLQCSALMVVNKAEPGVNTPCVACRKPLCFYCRTRPHPGLSCGEVKVSKPPKP